MPRSRPTTNRKGKAMQVFAPRMTWKVAENPGEKLTAVVQLLYKLALGFILNQVGYYFFVTMYYLVFENGFVKPGYDNPHLALLSVSHVVVIHGVRHVIWVAKPWYVWFRHDVIRGAGEYLFRIGFAVLALTDPLSARRQAGEHTRAAEWMARYLPFIPNEAQGRPTGPIQLALTPLTSYIAGIPGIGIMFGLEGLLWTLQHQTAHWHGGALGAIASGVNSTAVWYGGFAPKAAGIVGGLMFAKFIYMKIAVDFQDLMVYWFRHHTWEPHFPLPATFRAYYLSGQGNPVKRTGWVTPILVALPMLLLIADYVGLYIIVHAQTTLQTHTIFSLWGGHMITNPAWAHMLFTHAGVHFLL
jgi:hypothetical protein